MPNDDEYPDISNMNQVNIQYYKTKICELILGSFQDKLCIIDFRYRKMRQTVDCRIKKSLNVKFVEQEDNVITETKKQISEYLNQQRQEFDIPILMVGSDFQKQVWDALIKIPYGKTVSYLQIAQNINNPKAVRAVGNANGANSLSIIIPCHRVIANDGGLGGYGGGLDIKKKLLNLEQVNCNNKLIF